MNGARIQRLKPGYISGSDIFELIVVCGQTHIVFIESTKPVDTTKPVKCTEPTPNLSFQRITEIKKIIDESPEKDIVGQLMRYFIYASS